MKLKDLRSLLLGLLVAAASLMIATPVKADSPGKNGRIAFVQGVGTVSDVFTMNPGGLP